NAVNQLRQENPAQQTMYFQIPLQIGNEIRNGEMLVVHQREKQGQKWDIASSWYRFYLETRFLGPVQINLQAVQKQLSIHFVVTGTKQSALLEQQKNQLSRILTHYGYEVADITCGVSNITPLFILDSDSADRQCVDITI
ncbi:MAG: flagellar hook-length control protein FliK, partial [Bacillota bacterium]